MLITYIVYDAYKLLYKKLLYTIRILNNKK